MKRFFVLMLAMGLLCSCQKSDQATAEKLIHDFMQTSLNNPKSYEPIKFSEVFMDYFTPYTIHSYRAESETGAVKKYVYLYQFDSDLTEIQDAVLLDSYIRLMTSFENPVDDYSLLDWAIEKVESDNDFKPAIAD